jgi:hypothetical protein
MAPFTYKNLFILFRFLGSLVHFVVLEINLPITLGSAFFYNCPSAHWSSVVADVVMPPSSPQKLHTASP